MDKVRIDLGDFKDGEAETYANFIRRVLLFEDSGYAPIGMRVNGGEAKTVFQIIDGLVEDLIQVYLNLMEAVYVGKGSDFQTSTLHVRNKKINVSDLSNDSLQVISDKVLATITGDRDFSIDVFVYNSKGFRNKEYNEELLLQKGITNAIVFDSRHSSIKAVGYDIISNGNGTAKVQMLITTTSDNLSGMAKALIEQSMERLSEIKNKF